MRKGEKEVKEACKLIEKKFKDVKCKYEYDDWGKEWRIMYNIDKDGTKFHDFIYEIREDLESKNIEVAIYSDENAFEEKKKVSIA